jgi:predicted transcriptional regulator of viral defense system
LNAIAQLRRNVGGEVFDYQVLLDALAAYRKPRDRITRLLASGAIMRVKKGLYCFGEAFRKEPLSREYLANLIYGPSYVSLEYALSHHGLIPERVETVTSVTTRRSRDFQTPFGAFSYRMLNGPRYAVGAIIETAGKTPFLVASPEKALVDKVWTDKRFSGLRVSDYAAYLSDDLRIDREALSRFDNSRLQVIATAYDSAKINNLVRYLKRLEGAPHA